MLKAEKASLKEFIELPFVLYKGNSHFVPELKSDTKLLLTKDPVWDDAERELFTVKKDGKPVGRIAAIVNYAHNKHWDDNTGFFGFFECIDDQEAANALIDAARDWLKSKGKSAIRGPLNPSTNHTCGMLADNFDKDPVVMMPYNPPYYLKLMENAGLTKAKDLVAFERTDKDCFSPRMEKIIARVERNPSVKVRHINMKDFSNEVEIVRTIYNASWSHNWGFVPISEAEIQNTAKSLKLVVKPEVTSVIEYDGKPAGFSICIPNMNRILKILGGGLNIFKLPKALMTWRNMKDCRMIMLGVHPDYRKKGLELLLIKKVVDDGVKAGWNTAELSWMLEDNLAIISVIEEAGCHKTKTYRIFEAAL